MGNCFFYSTFYSLLHQVSVKLTTVTPKIPNTVHYSKTCNGFLRITDVIVTSHPRLNNSPLSCVSYWS